MHVQNFLDNDRDKPRGRKIVKMRVKVRNARFLTLPDGNLVDGPGEHEISVYEDRVPAVMSLVETDRDALALAHSDFELQIAREVKQAQPDFRGTDAEMRALIKSKKDEAVNATYKRVVSETTSSIQSCFLSRMGRDVLPLEHAELVEGSGEMEPQRKRELALAKQAADELRVNPVSSEEFENAVAAAVEKKLREMKGQRG